MSGVNAAPAPRAGRPRRFEAEDELRILLDAGFVVMERNGYTDAAVADILREANLSTRSFYRHFQSKDELLCALYRRDADAAVVRLCTRVESAGNPRAALDAWIDEILSFGHHRAKAARLAVLGSPGAMKAEGYAAETRRAATLLMAPLQSLLVAGAADGTFPLADPAADAPLIQSAVWAAAGLAPNRERPASRAEAARHVRSFCERALGVGCADHTVQKAPSMRRNVPPRSSSGDGVL
jgi:AcrR family transcriptional regulator